MIKKTIQYHNLDGILVSKDFYFHLSQADLLELEVTSEEDGGYRGYLEKKLAENNRTDLVRWLKEFVGMCVGEKSGEAFVKTEAIRNNFIHTEAWAMMLIEFLQNPRLIAEFMKGVAPAHMSSKVDIDTVLKEAGIELPSSSIVTVTKEFVDPLPEHNVPPAQVETARKAADYTDEEIVTMSSEEFDRIFGTDVRKWNKHLLSLAMMRRNNEK